MKSENKNSNYIQNLPYEFSQAFCEYEYSYENNFMGGFSDKLMQSDLSFSEQTPSYFSGSLRFDNDLDLSKSISLNDKINFDFGVSNQNNFESIHETQKKCVSVYSNKFEDIVVKKDEKSLPTRTCSGTQLSLDFIQDDEQIDDISNNSDSDDIDQELTPEFKQECEFGDLNIFVEKLLNSTTAEYLKDQGIEVDDETIQKLSINKRKRKTKKQKELLDAEYTKNPNWSKSFMKNLAYELSISLSSIYKWHWDQRHKDEELAQTKSSKKRQTKQK